MVQCGRGLWRRNLQVDGFWRYMDAAFEHDRCIECTVWRCHETRCGSFRKHLRGDEGLQNGIWCNELYWRRRLVQVNERRNILDGNQLGNFHNELFQSDRCPSDFIHDHTLLRQCERSDIGGYLSHDQWRHNMESHRLELTDVELWQNSFCQGSEQCKHRIRRLRITGHNSCRGRRIERDL